VVIVADISLSILLMYLCSFGLRFC